MGKNTNKQINKYGWFQNVHLKLTDKLCFNY